MPHILPSDPRDASAILSPLADSCADLLCNLKTISARRRERALERLAYMDGVGFQHEETESAQTLRLWPRTFEEDPVLNVVIASRDNVAGV
jgi:hypothetical protein